MLIAGIVAAVILGIAILVLLYWSLIGSMYPETVTTEEIHTVTTGDIWKLRVCRYRKGLSEGEPVLLVHGINANQHTFTIPQGDSLVDSLVKRGYDCWAVDLRGTRSSQPPFERDHYDATIDDFLLHDLPAVIDYIRQTTGFAKVHWVGHSLGGMLLYAYVQAFGAAQIASGTTLGSPIGFKKTRIWAPNGFLFLVRMFPHALGNLLRGAVPIWYGLGIPTHFFPANMRNFHAGVSVGQLYNLIEDPLPDVQDELVYWAKHQLWTMKDDTLDVAAGLPDMRFPLLAIYGPRDPFIDLDTAQAFINSLRHDDKKLLVLSKDEGCEEDYDHCELPFGKDAESTVYAPVAAWISAHPSKERVSFSELGEEEPPDYRPPLNDAQRAAILSGERFAAVDDEAPAPDDAGAEETPADEPSAPAETAEETPARKPATKKKAAARRAPAKKPAARKAPAKKKAAAEKPAAKKAPAKKKAAAKKPAAGKAPAKKKAAASKTPRLVQQALEEASDMLDNL